MSTIKINCWYGIVAGHISDGERLVRYCIRKDSKYTSQWLTLLNRIKSMIFFIVDFGKKIQRPFWNPSWLESLTYRSLQFSALHSFEWFRLIKLLHPSECLCEFNLVHTYIIQFFIFHTLHYPSKHRKWFKRGEMILSPVFLARNHSTFIRSTYIKNGTRLPKFDVIESS